MSRQVCRLCGGLGEESVKTYSSVTNWTCCACIGSGWTNIGDKCADITKQCDECYGIGYQWLKNIKGEWVGPAECFICDGDGIHRPNQKDVPNVPSQPEMVKVKVVEGEYRKHCPDEDYGYYQPVQEKVDVSCVKTLLDRISREIVYSRIDLSPLFDELNGELDKL